MDIINDFVMLMVELQNYWAYFELKIDTFCISYKNNFCIFLGTNYENICCAWQPICARLPLKQNVMAKYLSNYIFDVIHVLQWDQGMDQHW